MPLPRYTPYVWVYSAATPAAMAAVPYVPCPKCQGKVDIKTLVAQETERMRTAPADFARDFAPRDAATR